jgi:hypothetical protein
MTPPALQAGAAPLGFPYMEWAQTRSFRARYALTHSGLPAADPARLGPPGLIDLSPPTPRAREFEAALARRFDVDPPRVVATLGASGGLFACAWAWFGAGARVVSELPSYEPFRALPARLGADLRLLERRLEDGWQLDPAAVRRALAGAARGHVFVCEPHNPTGAELGAGRLSELGRAARDAGGYLVSCEIYGEFVPWERRAHAFRAAPNGVSIGSLTKAYGLGALRAGWIVLGEEVAGEAARLRDALHLSWVDGPTGALRASCSALGQLDPLFEPYRALAGSSRPLWARWLASTPGVQAHVPEHGLVAFARVASAPDTRALADWLAAEHDVGVVAGEHFGAPGHLRVAFGLAPAELAEGLARLARGIAAWPSHAR